MSDPFDKEWVVMLTKAEYFVDSTDVSRLHLAALIDPEVNGERVLAYKEPYNWNHVLLIFRKMYPGRKFVDDLPDQGEDKSTVDTERSEEILKRMGADGFTSLEQSLKWTVEPLAEGELGAENSGWVPQK